MLNVSVISPEAVLFEGETDSVVAPAYDGEVGILTGHAPMMALLGKGVLRAADSPAAASGSTSRAGSCRSSTTRCAS